MRSWMMFGWRPRLSDCGKWVVFACGVLVSLLGFTTCSKGQEVFRRQRPPEVSTSRPPTSLLGGLFRTGDRARQTYENNRAESDWDQPNSRRSAYSQAMAARGLTDAERYAITAGRVPVHQFAGNQDLERVESAWRLYQRELARYQTRYGSTVPMGTEAAPVAWQEAVPYGQNLPIPNAQSGCSPLTGRPTYRWLPRSSAPYRNTDPYATTDPYHDVEPYSEDVIPLEPWGPADLPPELPTSPRYYRGNQGLQLTPSSRRLPSRTSGFDVYRDASLDSLDDVDSWNR